MVSTSRISGVAAAALAVAAETTAEADCRGIISFQDGSTEFVGTQSYSSATEAVGEGLDSPCFRYMAGRVDVSTLQPGDRLEVEVIRGGRGQVIGTWDGNSWVTQREFRLGAGLSSTSVTSPSGEEIPTGGIETTPPIVERVESGGSSFTGSFIPEIRAQCAAAARRCLNTGVGTFEETTLPGGGSITINVGADANGDGQPDLEVRHRGLDGESASACYYGMVSVGVRFADLRP